MTHREERMCVVLNYMIYRFYMSIWELLVFGHIIRRPGQHVNWIYQEEALAPKAVSVETNLLES